MEANCCVICDMPTSKLRDKAFEFLTEGNRPVFEDEIEPVYRKLFNALEYTEYPEDLRKISDKTICAYFFMGGDFDEDVRYFFKCLHEGGTLHAFAAIDADEFEGLIHMDEKGNIQTLGKEYQKIMGFMSATDDESGNDEESNDDLVSVYQRLEQVKTLWMSSKND
ncbi:MAG: hypothetical protein JAY90_21870 [Candidatus Thiodiazotropha lotti]|nr:hypothetical protein [Candidatus Thiodiazotropha lotti]